MEAQRSDRKTDFFPIQPTSNVLRKTYVNQNSSKYKYIGLKSVEAQNGPKMDLRLLACFSLSLSLSLLSRGDKNVEFEAF